MKTTIKLFALLGISISLVACTNTKSTPKEVKDIGLIHEPEFGGVYVKKTIEEFNNLGYTYGDSVDVTFSNGFKYENLPYYNGYYVDAGQSLLVGYPGYDYIKVAINYGDDVWTVADLKETDTASIKLNTKNKYKDIQEASDIHYLDEREKYTSNEEFANFRNIKVGEIKQNILYRSASPCDNQHNRASYVDALIKDAGVEFILNLADTKEKIDGYIAKDDFNSPYFLELYERDSTYTDLGAIGADVEPLAMNMNYRSAEFATKLANGFKQMATQEGPYLVHCTEGKDRTGYVCMVIEALMGATYQEMVDDYMITYQNYYFIDKNDARYEILKKRNIDAMLRFILGDETADLTKAEFVTATTEYLKTAGMTDAQIQQFKNKLK